MKRWSAICLGLIILVAGCDGHTSVNGVVVGPDDIPIAGVKVRLTEPGNPTGGWDSTTDEDGHYSVGLTHAPFDIPLVVMATRDGYKPYRKEFKVSERDRFPKKIMLEPDPNALAAKE
jgi:hypothetical protein